MFRISGAGCSLLDLIYANVDLSAKAVAPYRSRSPGDGGLESGRLVFTEDFERFAGRGCLEALAEITGGQTPQTNIGGPAVVALINAVQLLDPARFSVRFVGTLGRDALGDQLRRLLALTPLDTSSYCEKPGLTPFTYVLSDPGHGGGQGERTFVNNIGTAWSLTADDLDDEFFESDLVVFGGTGLVPRLHDALDVLLLKARAARALTVVTTVYDFRSQRSNPTRRWPLGSSDRSYALIDLLIADLEEALRLSGASTGRAAVEWFVAQGVGAVLVTDGARPIEAAAASPLFLPLSSPTLPVSRWVLRELEAHPERRGDTTGCGDNFAGGVLASLANQSEAGHSPLDLEEAAAWGAACGGLACFHVGGVFREDFPGQKRQKVEACVEADLAPP